MAIDTEHKQERAAKRMMKEGAWADRLTEDVLNQTPVLPLVSTSVESFKSDKDEVVIGTEQKEEPQAKCTKYDDAGEDELLDEVPTLPLLETVDSSVPTIPSELPVND